MKGYQTWVFCLSERVWYFCVPHGSSAKYPSSTSSIFHFFWLSNPFRRKSIWNLIFSFSWSSISNPLHPSLFTFLSLHTLDALNTQFPTLWARGVICNGSSCWRHDIQHSCGEVNTSGGELIRLCSCRTLPSHIVYSTIGWTFAYQ